MGVACGKHRNSRFVHRGPAHARIEVARRKGRGSHSAQAAASSLCANERLSSTMIFGSHRAGEVDGAARDVRVDIHATRKHDQARRVDRSSARHRRGEPAAVVDEKVLDDPVNTVGRVVDFSTSNSQHRLHLFRDHLWLASIGQPERLPGDRFIDPADNFFIRWVRRFQSGPQRHRKLIHAIGGPRCGDPLGRRRNVNARQPAGVCDVRVQHDRRNPLQMVDRRLRHRGARVRTNDKRRVTIATDQHINRREFARVIARVTSVEADAKGKASLPAHDHVGSGHIAMSAHRHGNELCEGIHFRRQGQKRGAVHVLAAGHGKSHTEEHATEFGRLHACDQVLDDFPRQAGFRNLFIADRLAFDHRAQDRDQLKIFTGPHLQEDVSGFDAFRFPNIHQHHRAVLAAARQKLAFLHDGVFREVPRMALGGIAAPINHEIGTLFDFAQRTRDLATQLGGDFGGTVSKRCVTVEQTSQQVGHRNTFFLCFAGRVAHAVDQRHVGGMQETGCRFDRFVDRRFPTVDQRVRVFLLGRVIQKPRRTEHAGFVRLVDANLIVVQLDIVADAATKGACGIVNNLQ